MLMEVTKWVHKGLSGMTTEFDGVTTLRQEKLKRELTQNEEGTRHEQSMKVEAGIHLRSNRAWHLSGTGQLQQMMKM